MGSLSQARVPSAVTVMVAESLGSRGSLVWVAGNFTGKPFDLLRLSVNKTKVARRKKITSINGITLIVAFFGLPPV